MLKTFSTIDPSIVESLVEATSVNDDAVALERDGRPVVFVISRGVYEELLELRAAHFEMLLDRSAAAFDHMTEQEIGDMVDADVEAAREELYRAGRLG